MRQLGRSLHAFLLLVLLSGFAHAGNTAARGPSEIRGEDPVTGLRFRADWEGESVQRFELEGGGVTIRVRLGVEPGPKWFVIESWSGVRSGPANLTAAGKSALRRLMISLRPMASPLEDSFVRVLNLLASWPARLPVAGSLRDGVIEAAGTRWHTAGSTEDILDICGKMNRLHQGSYPVFFIPRPFESIVGPYPWSDGECLGRCGAGCPGDGPPNNSVFAFGQDCFNHDACVRDQGLLDVDCDLIFPPTFDDFLYGPSCQKDNADIKINGQDGPVQLAASDPIQVRISLMNVPPGRTVDYWLYAQTDAGTYWLDPNGNWILSSAPIAARTGALVAVFDRPVYSGPLPPGYPLGVSTFYLSVDLVPDRTFSARQFEDAAEVELR